MASGVPARRLSMWLGVASTSILATFAVNFAADRFPQAKGLNTLRDYLYRRNG